MPEPIRLFQIDRPDHPTSTFPPLRSTDRVVGNLPAPMSSFVGRGDEVRALQELVRTERLVTVTGPGGVGKTRAALEAATGVASSFPGGVWFVELAPVGDPGAVASAVASALEIRSQGASAVAAVADQLATGSSLLVLDNCEHVVDAVAELMEVVQRRAPGVHLIVTSREAIGVGGERVVPLRPMPPEAAVALFVERARALDPTLDATTDRTTAEVLVTRLDGIPLAIELAAARTTTMTVDELLAALDHRLTLLAGGRRRSVERHATMRATLDWSHDLLTEQERILLRRLAVFPAAFTMAAAVDIDAVAAVSAVVDVGDVLGGLVGKSLVQPLPASRGHRRFRLLETVRSYALERLAEAGETEVLGRAHVEWILGRYRRMGLTESIATRSMDDYHELIELRQDIRAAIDWCLVVDDVVRVVALAAPHPRVADLLHDAVAWVDLILTNGTAVPPRDRFLLHLVAAEGKMLHAAHPSEAYPDVEAAEALRPTDDHEAVMLRRVVALRSWFRDGDPAATAAHADAEDAAHLADQAGDHHLASLILGLADQDPEPNWRRGDELASGSGRTNAGRATAVAATARWRARRGLGGAVPMFLEAMAEVRPLPPGPIRSIVAGLTAGGLADLDADAARQILVELIDPDRGDLVSPSDIVRAAIGMMLYLTAIGQHDDRAEILGRTLHLPGASRLIGLYARELELDVPHIEGTHLELLGRMRTLLVQQRP